MFIPGDLSTLDDASNVFSRDDDEGLITLKEMLNNSHLASNGTDSGKKPPRPSSIPAAKKFSSVSLEKSCYDCPVVGSVAAVKDPGHA